MPHVFPDPKEVAHERPVVFHRFRVVIPAYDEEQAQRIADKVAEFASCNVERIWAVTDSECKEVLGEGVIQRRTVHSNDRVPEPMQEQP